MLLVRVAIAMLKDCVFEVGVTLHGPAAFYELSLHSEFEKLTMSRADLEAANWRLELSY
jgi:hypothetical protein